MKKPCALFIAFFLFCQHLTAQRQDVFDAFIKTILKTDSVPGASFLIVKKGKVVKEASYGFANLELQVQANQQTVYELASISKPITATAIMQLVQAGKVVLDSSVYYYLGDLVTEKYRTITVKQLMSHISGIASDHFVYTKLYGPSVLRYTVKEQLTDLFKLKPENKPGEKYIYSNAGFFLQAAIIEKVTKQTYQQYITTHIFEKAGMKRSYFLNGDSLVLNRAQGYTKRKGTWVRFSLETTLQALDANGFGGISSTTQDLSLFVKALLNGNLINTDFVQQMFTIIQLNNGTKAGPGTGGSNIGLGWFVKEVAGKKCISHSGHTGTVLLFFPEEDLTIVFLSNLSFGIYMLGDKGFRVNEIGYELAEMALKQYGTK